MKTCFAFVFRRCLKTSSRRLDQNNIFVLVKLFQDIFKAISRRPQDAFKTFCKTFCQDVFKTSCKSVFKCYFKDVSKTSSRLFQDILKTSSRRIIRQNCFRRSRICLCHTSEKVMLSVES